MGAFKLKFQDQKISRSWKFFSRSWNFFSRTWKFFSRAWKKNSRTWKFFGPGILTWTRSIVVEMVGGLAFPVRGSTFYPALSISQHFLSKIFKTHEYFYQFSNGGWKKEETEGKKSLVGKSLIWSAHVGRWSAKVALLIRLGERQKSWSAKVVLEKTSRRKSGRRGSDRRKSGNRFNDCYEKKYTTP